MRMTLDYVIHALGLKRRPEGGFYAETHRIDATEIWRFYAGAPLELSLSPGKGVETHVLGPDLSAGQRPQVIVPVGHWQSARTTGDWTLVGCTVSPGFEFSGFEMAAPDRKPAP